MANVYLSSSYPEVISFTHDYYSALYSTRLSQKHLMFVSEMAFRVFNISTVSTNSIMVTYEIIMSE